MAEVGKALGCPKGLSLHGGEEVLLGQQEPGGLRGGVGVGMGMVELHGGVRVGVRVCMGRGGGGGGWKRRRGSVGRVRQATAV